MRCPECNKFARYEYQEPEISDLRVEADGGISGECRIVLACEEDGAELKESVLEIDVDCGEALVGHEGAGHELEVEDDGAEATERSDRKPGTPARYRKTFYGAKASFTVTCSCKGLGENGDGVTFEWEDDVQASSMDELT